MPQRINIVGDLGTTKVASDSYDIDNIYLTEEGWVYRHFKSTDESRWWDEIIVAGQVDAATNAPCEATNPPPLGTVPTPTFETGGDSNYDIEYSEHLDTAAADGSYTTKVVTDGGGVPTLNAGSGGGGGSGAAQAVNLVSGGTGYSTGSGVATTGGNGNGLTVNITSVSTGVITGLTIASAGSGYQNGDTVTITGGGNDATATVVVI